MQYWLGPWQWLADQSVPGPSWNPPAGAIASIRLHGVDAAPEKRHGFFAMPDRASRPAEYLSLGSGDCRQIDATPAVMTAWQSVTGYRPGGAKLVDLLWDQLTNGAEANAEGGPGPLTPRHDGTTNLLLTGHSRVKSLSFGTRLKTAGRWHQVITAQLRSNFARHWERDQTVASKLLAEYVAKYRLGSDWQHVVPPNLRPHVPGPLRPTTAYADSLVGRTEALNAGNWQYYTTSQNFQVVTTGAYLASGSGYRQAEYASALSSDDHWSEFEWVSAIESCGPCVRSTNYNSTTPSHYYGQQYSGLNYISEVNSGGPTNLASGANTHAIGNVDRLLVTGSDLEAYVNDVLKVSTTDTTITGSTSVGILIVVAAGTAQLKAWAGEDISAGAAGGPWNYYAQQ